MKGITWIHIAGGMLALVTGAVAIAVRKGGRMHVSAGTWFCVAMFVLGVTASILSPFKSPPESPIGGIMVCYFVATAWMAARRRSGTPGRFEKLACAIALAIAAAILGHGFEVAQAPPGQFSGPPGPGALFALGGLCLLAGLSDLRFILRGKLSATQRLSRHLWRMCFAFCIATGSFFLGQQDVLPQAVRASPILWVLAFAPFALMLFWLARVRFSRIGQSKQHAPLPAENDHGLRPRLPFAGARPAKGTTPIGQGDQPMKNDTLLTVTSLLAIVLMTLHLADDVVRGFEPGGLKNLTGIAILVVWLAATLLLVGRRLGYVILLLGSLLAAAMPVVHMSGKGVGGQIAESPGGYFFIWTLFALGVTGTFSLILTVRGLWSLRWRQPR